MLVRALSPVAVSGDSAAGPGCLGVVFCFMDLRALAAERHLRC